MRLPIRPIRGRWPRFVESFAPLRRFFRRDPLTILDDRASPEAFREAMSSIYVGGTIKITGSDRHPEPDQLLIDTLDTTGVRIADIGASDGSTSVDLVARLNGFSEYVIADLYLYLTAVDLGSHTVLFDGDRTCVLVGGRRLSAWPDLSRFVGVLYQPLIREARTRLDAGHGRQVLLLNPSARRLIETDPRVVHRTHDVFEPWSGPRPDVIKVANLLRRLYFDDADLTRALHALHANLPDGGHLMIVDNPRLTDPAPRAGIWRREGDRFREVARLGDPEIADLINRVGQ